VAWPAGIVLLLSWIVLLLSWIMLLLSWIVLLLSWVMLLLVYAGHRAPTIRDCGQVVQCD
jgi:hypothetical protein